MDFSEFDRNIGSARKKTWRMKLDPQAVEICGDFQYIRSSGSHFNYCYCLSLKRHRILEAWDGQKISSSKNVFLLNAAITETGKLSWLHAKYPIIVYGKDFFFIIRFLRYTTYQITESMQESL